MNREKVLLGITGGIAAYKSAEIARLFIKEGYDLQVIMTPAATEFVTPLTFQALSGNPVFCRQFEEHGQRIKHIELAQSPAFILIAPATYNTVSKIAAGIADNLLTTVLAAATVPVFIVPSMNDRMYDNPATQENLALLGRRGFFVLEPDCGELACGVSGRGRMPEPDKILAYVLERFRRMRDFAGKKVLVTAGPTREPLDPVRYFGNHSSGKMGFAVASAFKERGAEVTVISGPTELLPPAYIEAVHVNTAKEMLDAVIERFDNMDIVVKAAAVADYRPDICADEKIKKENDLDMTVTLKRNPDILKMLGRRKEKQILVGFAAETENLLANAAKKLKEKNLDFIVANDVTKEKCGFQSETNEVTVISAGGKKELIPLASKDIIAHRLLDIILRESI